MDPKLRAGIAFRTPRTKRVCAATVDGSWSGTGDGWRDRWTGKPFTGRDAVVVVVAVVAEKNLRALWPLMAFVRRSDTDHLHAFEWRSSIRSIFVVPSVHGSFCCTPTLSARKIAWLMSVLRLGIYGKKTRCVRSGTQWASVFSRPPRPPRRHSVGNATKRIAHWNVSGRFPKRTIFSFSIHEVFFAK